MSVASLILLLAVSVSVQGKCVTNNSGICPPSPPVGDEGPFEGKESVKADFERIGGGGSHVGTCKNGEENFETWVLTDDNKFVETYRLMCIDKNGLKPVEWDGIYGQWQYTEEEGRYKNANKLVCAQPTGCSNCVHLPVASEDKCLKEKKCDSNTSFHLLDGPDGSESSDCVLACDSEVMFVELDDGNMVEVDKIQCNSTTHEWFGTKGTNTYIRKPRSLAYCIKK